MWVSTAVILAGGGSRRMGSDKLKLTLNGSTLLESAVARFSAGFDRVLVSVASPDARAGEGFETVPDIVPGRGPLSGLHAALTRADETPVFLVAGDMPFAEPRAALRLMELCADHEICVIDNAGRIEPLFGAYRKTLLPRVTLALRERRLGMTELLASSDTLYVPRAELGELWNERLLVNINRPCDYEKLISGGLV
jgi:molybdopterin-guanine dinucleotide biosynthesis protein A